MDMASMLSALAPSYKALISPDMDTEQHYRYQWILELEGLS